MLAMTGTLRFDSVRALGELARRLCSYHSVRVSDTERVVLVPPIGSFLVDWDSARVRLHVVASAQRDLDEIIMQLDTEVRKVGSGASIDWTNSAAVPAPLR
ncbi:hypothetical protein BH11ACT5_BH11ACT5_09840 [soil metagenome]